VFGASSTLYVDLDGKGAGTSVRSDRVTGAANTLTIDNGASITGEASYTYSASAGGDTLTIISSPSAASGPVQRIDLNNHLGSELQYQLCIRGKSSKHQRRPCSQPHDMGLGWTKPRER